MKWRERAAPVIALALEQTRGRSEAEIRKALYEAYPFGERRWHPYKIWLDEIKVQRGRKPLRVKHARGELIEVHPDQQMLFEHPGA